MSKLDPITYLKTVCLLCFQSTFLESVTFRVRTLCVFVTTCELY